MSLIMKKVSRQGGALFFDLRNVRHGLLPGVFIRGAMLVSFYIVYGCYSSHLADKKCV